MPYRDPKKNKLYKKEYYQLNKEKIDKRTLGYYHAHKELIKPKMQKYAVSVAGRMSAKNRQMKYQKSEKSKIRYRRAALKAAYGITVEQYDQMLTAQNCICAICGSVNNDGRRLAVDHNHKTGKVRKLLCSRCNLVLGYVDDSLELIEKFRLYLTTFIEPTV